MPNLTPGVRESARLARVDLSIGSLDLLRFVEHDHDFPRHSHDHFTVGVFDVGSGSLRYRGATYRATDAALLAVPPDEVHEGTPFPRGGWTYRSFYPTVELMRLALGDDHPPVFFPAPVFADAALAGPLLRLHRELTAGRRDLAVETRLLDVLRRLVRDHSVNGRARPGRMPTQAVTAARDYLEANFGRQIKLGELARVCQTSPFHLVRSFRGAYGMPPHAYLTQVRATRARGLLLRGESPSSAAYQCGFCDQSHLTRMFKRYFGVTPGAYAAAARLASA